MHGKKRAKTGRMIIGVLLSFSVLLAMMCGYALLLQNGALGENTIGPVSLVAMFASALIGVLFSLHDGRKMYGILPALSLAVLVLLGRILTSNSRWDGSHGWMLILAAMLPAVFLLGRKKGRSRR